MSDQRKNQRFDLQLPLEVVRAGSRALAVSGYTRNISSSGVLFSSDSEVELGEPVEYILTLPPKNDDPGKVNLRCVGKVVRFQEPAHATDSRAVEVTLERYEFLRSNNGEQ